MKLILPRLAASFMAFLLLGVAARATPVISITGNRGADSSIIYLVVLAFSPLAPANLAIMPTTGGPFTNGVWTGTITVPQPATNLVLGVNDGAGHQDASNPFVVAPHAPQKLQAGLAPDGTLVLTSGYADGAPLPPGDLANFELQASADLVNWTSLTNAPVLTNGMLKVADPGSANQPRRFYRMVEH